MPTETQEHLLHDGKRVILNRNGAHQYWVGSNSDQPSKMPGVTAMTGLIDSSFGAGMGWALKVAREHGDLDAPRRLSKEAQDAGTQVHDDIHQYISTGNINEESPQLPLFMNWMRHVGEQNNFTASEKLLYNPHMTPKYGGTADAFSLATIWDWKVKLNEESYAKYGGSPRDHAQLSAYALALKSMGSVYRPSRGFLVYILPSGVDIVEVNLNKGAEIFKAAHQLYTLLKEAKQ